MKHRTTDPDLLRAHDNAWNALKALPLNQEIDRLFDVLDHLQTWHVESENFEQHMARYEAGKPQEIRARIDTLQSDLLKTPENIAWYEYYQLLYAEPANQ